MTNLETVHRKRRYATRAIAKQDTPGFARLRRQMTALEELWRTVPHIEMSHLCPLVIDRAVTALEAHTGSLFLRDRGTDLMRLTASVGLSSEVNQSMTIIIGDGIAGRVAESRQSVLMHKDPDAHPLMQGRKSRIKQRAEIESAIDSASSMESVPLRNARALNSPGDAWRAHIAHISELHSA